MKYLVLICSLMMSSPLLSQDYALPFQEIPNEPEDYTAGNVMGRLIDGLGFRYYWATDSLSATDLEYRPTPESRSIGETVDHLYGLSLTIVNAPQSLANERPMDWSQLSFEQIRRATLLNFQKASHLLKAGAASDMENYRVIFQRGDNVSEFPFWNMINGPIADALYHTGQVVTLRRSAGNPINPNISVFTGKLRD